MTRIGVGGFAKLPKTNGDAPDQSFSPSLEYEAHATSTSDDRRSDDLGVWHPLAVLRRTASLGSDVIVLTLAAPFFAVWFLYKTVKRWTGAR